MNNNNSISIEEEENQIKFSEYIQLTNHTFGGADGKFFNHMLGGNYKEEQFTIVILTYRREEILTNLLSSYLKLPYLNSILIIWNSLDITPSSEFVNKFYFYLTSKRLRVIQSKVNSLNNRFLPYNYIETDAVLSLDDDVNLR